MNEEYTITVEKAAEILNCSKKTVYRKLRSGDLNGKKLEVKTGLKWFISSDALDKAIMETEVIDIAEVEKEISLEEFENKFQKMLHTVSEEVRNVIQEENQNSNDHIREIIREEIQQALKKQPEKKGLWNKLIKKFKVNYFNK